MTLTITPTSESVAQVFSACQLASPVLALPEPAPVLLLAAPPETPRLAAPSPVLALPVPTERARFLWGIERRLDAFPGPFRVDYAPRTGAYIYSGEWSDRSVLRVVHEDRYGTVVYPSVHSRNGWAAWEDVYKLFFCPRSLFEILRVVIDLRNDARSFYEECS
ncbi:MAG: hypothetical protein JW963_21295 [Anaerolineales bacterium]|nr:hypothetical protein [Anaerolineales bacterium]